MELHTLVVELSNAEDVPETTHGNTRGTVVPLDALEGRIAELETLVPEVKYFLENRVMELKAFQSSVDRVDAFEAKINELEMMMPSLTSLQGQLKEVEVAQQKLSENFDMLVRHVKESTGSFNERLNEVGGQMNTLAQLQSQVQELDSKLNMTKQMVSKLEVKVEREKMKLPRPQAYGGSGFGIALDDFLFGLEMYFKAARIETDEARVTLGSMYLTGGAMAWWRRKYEYIQNHQCTMPTWEKLQGGTCGTFLLRT
ncbi:uncharacterized protein LOC131165455 [Malania oleifera]|uniref:uncharacterized protein LOC131165455 n=1 Tax=Malania oleifera TaxID=397392 RepID=UPI0025ADD9C5|nr:uncharacterized protein LOC131165455 [Malania oleifera]XP_057979284.1 uncharacterized protein LOC131165455 [Malania oleifera]XP_057979285.1 uncharacterized protein LOC131165455 [Malania oleifera]